MTIRLSQFSRPAMFYLVVAERSSGMLLDM